MTKKIVAALVALIMVFALLPAGAFPAFADGNVLTVGDNIISSADEANYTFIAPDDGFYGFTVPASDEVPASIVISADNTNYESRIISNGSQKSAFAAVELDANDVCAVTISRPAAGVCTVTRMTETVGSNNVTIFQPKGNFSFWFAFRPEQIGTYEVYADADSYAYVKAYTYTGGELYDVSLSEPYAGQYIYEGWFVTGKVYYLNIYGRADRVPVGFSFIEPVNNIITVEDHALMLSSGDVGVIFDASIPDDYTDGSYMEFITGNVGRQRMTSADAYDRSTGKYRFVCPIGAYRMADEITPVFHYFAGGQDKTVILPPYSVQDYIEHVVTNTGSYDENVINAVKALSDYGYWSQRYLAGLHGFSTGDDGKYKVVQYCFTPKYSKAYIKEQICGYMNSPFNVNDMNGVEKITCSLSLESEISLYIYVTLDTEFTDMDSITATLNNGAALNVKHVSENTLRIEIKGIKASQLGDRIGFTLWEWDEYAVFTADISPLYYIYRVLDNYSDNAEKTALCNAACALYCYYDALTKISSTSGNGGNGGDEPVPYNP